MTTNFRRAQAYSVVGRAVECGEKSLGVRCHSQTAESPAVRLPRTNYGGHSHCPSAPVCRYSLAGPQIHVAGSVAFFFLIGFLY